MRLGRKLGTTTSAATAAALGGLLVGPATPAPVAGAGEPVAPAVAGAAGPTDGARALPASRSGQELLGKPLDLRGLRWVRPPAGPVAAGADSAPAVPGVEGLAGRVTLLRWFTDRCPFCARSLPAVTALAERFGGRGFQTVAVYHPKPPRAAVEDEDAILTTAAIDYGGPLAVDPDWSVLRRVYLRRHRDAPTSVSFLLDRAGRVRYVHPGVEFGPTDDPRREDVNQDYEDLKAAVTILLDEETGP